MTRRIGQTVLSIYDDDAPLVGWVVGWEDEERCYVAWGDAAYSDDPWAQARLEFADQLVTRGRKPVLP